MWHWLLFLLILIVIAYYLAYKRHRGPLRGDLSNKNTKTGKAEKSEKVEKTNRNIIKIVYSIKSGDTETPKELNNNEFISPDNAAIQPHVRWRGTPEANKKYTLIMVDPDSKFKEWRHWLVVNISDKNPKHGVVISPYKPPQPPKGSGEHRYIFKWYEQPGDLSPTIKLDEFPGNWSSDAFASEHNLKLLGYTQFRSATI
jgi:phosphatidylethanolamine-binding protein (PEBP) family uncharacterized protein